ncbi:lysozyme [Chitinophaga terrae (ex Kim and Jung 2007)]|uniref:Lysozyme n=1 Tax=Chitinophaga terrae (ex Kim and Jung 2007) TaxID=408074 RepID=A0A1H4ECL4_9BACT|nr:glycoside hydrolase family 25 protein [Chitinophaga terrae (ex Kim and Jung 2007)]MDQ0105490.1 lysozyme [Chitinophaga terrae (ex Kim and Jung 2007)]GEP91531.1 glycosyl hydrolase [Chitinophaga terrae (ex Kim and Jung 2007)]SEA82320.1 lysozyme [Chitinophaga terrae (ex Kim and Jung 2007)]
MKSVWIRLIALGFVLCLALTAYFIWTNINNRDKFVRYQEFGIDIPVNYKIHGIDVSKFQKEINWQAVKQMRVQKIRISFAFIKATEGITRQDPSFKDNWEKAGKAGIIRGAYHFFYATRNPIKQAINFNNVVTLQSGDLPPVLDIETTNNLPASVIRSTAKIWLEEMERVYKVKPIIYTNIHFYETYLGDEFDGYPLWIAHYYQKERPRSVRNWKFWQHSDIGRVNGIRTTVDFNVFKGDSTDLAKLCLP